MDYPKSVANVGLVDGKFVDENTATGLVGSLIPSEWGNAVTDEILGVIQAAEADPSEADTTQLLRAIRQLSQAGAATYSSDTGSANVYKAAYTPAVTALKDGMVLRFKVKTTNTGISTFATDALTAKPIVTLGHAPLVGGELIANGRVSVQYSATLDAWILLSASGGNALSGRLAAVKIITSTSTYTPTPGMTFAIVEVVGGGGGGGGTPATSSGQFAASGGGGAGSYTKSIYTAAQIGASQSITIGAAGAGGAAGAAGGDGGASTFGSLMRAPGGTGAVVGAAAATSVVFAMQPGGSGGLATGGNLMNTGGGSGQPGLASINGGAIGGAGAGSPIAGGVGGGSHAISTGGANTASINGAGGSGVAAGASVAGKPGGAGNTGAVIITEYF